MSTADSPTSYRAAQFARECYSMKFVLHAHAASTWAMVGLIWFVQIVHYPLFGSVGTRQFPSYEQQHQRLTTYVVAPLMLVELFTAVLLCFATPPGVPRWLAWLGAGLVLVIWLSTYFLQVPAHTALSSEFSDVQHARLVSSNWLRTIAWSLRGVIALAILDMAGSAARID